MRGGQKKDADAAKDFAVGVPMETPGCFPRGSAHLGWGDEGPA
jgi:hypothetical protein